jgi:hypothetical protein
MSGISAAHYVRALKAKRISEAEAVRGYGAFVSGWLDHDIRALSNLYRPFPWFASVAAGGSDAQRAYPEDWTDSLRRLP